MRKHIGFTIAATIAGLVMFFWINAGVVESNADAARPTSSPMSNPYLPIQILDPVY